MTRFLLWAFVSAFFLTAGTGASRSSVPSPKPHAPICGARNTSHDLIEPPDVEMWTLPRNADGDPELILAVHRSGDQFCYRYRLNGVEQTTQPTIRVRRGERFALRIVNDIRTPSAGERVASNALPHCLPMPMPGMAPAHYVGYLNHTVDDRFVKTQPFDTNIHLHGFIGPAAEEDIFLSTLSTPMHACEYRITIPRTQPPGTYFYHPHSHGASRQQVEGGLSGAWIVEPDSPQIPASADHVIVLRYQLPARNDNTFAPNDGPLFEAGRAHFGALKWAAPVAYDPFNPPLWPVPFPVSAGSFSFNSNGCDGNFAQSLISVDGADAPARLAIAGGQTQLIRIVNATSESTKTLRLNDSLGRPQRFRVVAMGGVPVSGDASHPESRYIELNRLLLPPADRADILITAPPGETLTLYSDHMCNGMISEFAAKQNLLLIHAVANSGATPEQARFSRELIGETPAAALTAWARAHPDRIHKRAMTFSEYEIPKTKAMPAHLAAFITDTTNRNFHEHEFWPQYHNGGTVPFNADVVVKAGTIEEWWLVNTTSEVHAFHIHQMSFVVENGGLGMPVTVDVAYVRPGTLVPNRADPAYPLLRPSITRVLLDFRHVPRGTFVFHCHMLLHEDRGMMGILRVE